MLSLGGLLACLLFSLFGILAARPFVLAQRMRSANDITERRALFYRQQNQRAEKEVRALSTNAGIEKAARALGYVRPGEMKLRIPGNPIN